MSWLPTLSRQKEIEEAVLGLSNRLGLSYPENGLKEYTDKLDISVFITEFPKENISGMIFYPEKSDDPIEQNENTKIFLSKKESNERRGFSLAHELGHFILHEHKTAYRIDKYNYEDDKEETEANFFAATLLMPEERFEFASKQTNSIQQMASWFGVSASAIQNRLLWLKKK